MLLESEENVGTSVTFYIPTSQVIEPPPIMTFGARSDSLAHSAGGEAQPGEKILLVDDDPLVLEVVKACLLRAKFEVIVAHDGTEGLDLFRLHQKDLSVVVSDITMPKMSGIDLVLQIRQIEPNTKILLISGDAEATREEKLVRLGNNPPPLIKKPFTLRELLEHIKRLS